MTRDSESQTRGVYCVSRFFSQEILGGNCWGGGAAVAKRRMESLLRQSLYSVRGRQRVSKRAHTWTRRFHTVICSVKTLKEGAVLGAWGRYRDFRSFPIRMVRWVWVTPRSVLLLPGPRASPWGVSLHHSFLAWSWGKPGLWKCSQHGDHLLTESTH